MNSPTIRSEDEAIAESDEPIAASTKVPRLLQPAAGTIEGRDPAAGDEAREWPVPPAYTAARAGDADAAAVAEADNDPFVPHAIELRVNGRSERLSVTPWVTLLDLLREQLELTGTKKGCDHGQCGACTVLVDGQRINSCLTLAVMQDGCDVTTIEGLAPSGAAAETGGELHPLQQAFIDCDALQCGYCTPGQICSGVGLMREGQAKTVDEVRELMSGNLCRCGAYPQIARAVSRIALGIADDATLHEKTATEPVVVGTVPA